MGYRHLPGDRTLAAAPRSHLPWQPRQVLPSDQASSLLPAGRSLLSHSLSRYYEDEKGSGNHFKHGRGTG